MHWMNDWVWMSLMMTLWIVLVGVVFFILIWLTDRDRDHWRPT